MAASRARPSRVCRLRQSLQPSLKRNVVAGTPLASRVSSTMHAIAFDDELPGEQDEKALRPPSAWVWCRAVPQSNLVVWYDFDEDTVWLIAVGPTSHPHPRREQ